MANSDKNILITPATNTSGDPRIVYTPNTAANVITQRLTDSGTISFEGSAGQLFSITNSLTGTLFSVNDISGIPSIDVADTGLVRIAPFSGTLAIGSTAVATSGGVSAKGSITTTATTQPGFIVKGIASQSASLLEIQNSSGSITANFTAPVNNVNRLNLGGTDLSATLGITVHASGGVGQVIRGAASQSANLQEWQSSAPSTVALVTSGGSIFSSANGGFGSTSALSTARLSVSAAASSIGIIVRGNATTPGNLQEWQDSSAGVHSGILSSGFLFVGGSSSAGGQIGITSEAATNRGMVIKGAAAQTANLNEWQDSSSNILASFSPVAQLFLGSNGLRGTQTVAIGTQTPSGTTNITITTGSTHGISVGQTVTISGVSPSGYNGGWTAQSGTTGTTLVVNIGSNPGAITVAGTVTQSPRLGITALSAQNVPLIVRAASGQVNHLQQWQDSSGTVLARIDGVTGQFQAPSIVSTNFQITSAGVLSVGASGAPASTQSYVLSTAATNVSQVIRGAASQSANLQEWQDNSGNILLAITSSGGIGTSGLTAIRPEANRNVALAANTGSYGGGQAVVFFGNAAAAPSSSPTGGGLLFVNAGALQYRGTSGSTQNIVSADGTISFTGSVTASENLRSTNSSGDEGGEIFLNKAATNTTLTGGVTIDVHQNRLRFFEQGGSARGYYLDISTGGTSAGTNLVGTATSVSNTVTGTNSADLVYGNMADNDQFRIRVGGTATNAGFVEIATADDGTEPIHVRQYTGVFTTLTRTATLLDGSGNTSFPGTVTGTTFIGSGASLTSIPAANVTGTLTSPNVATSLITSSASFDLINLNATTVNFAGAATTLNIGNTATAAQTVNMFTSSVGSSTYNFATGAVGTGVTKTLNIGTGAGTAGTTTINLGGNPAVSTSTINLNAGTINSSATTLALLATPATITMGAAVTTLNIAGTTANVTTNLATGATAGSKLINIGTGSSSGSTTINIGSTSGTSTITINGTITGTPTAAAAATSATAIGYIGMPQNSQSGAYGLVAGDAGKHIYYTVTGQTVTIPANSNVAFQIGTTITFITAPSVSLSIAITTDTLRLANTATTGTRTLAANGMATAVKVTSTAWVISGNGLT